MDAPEQSGSKEGGPVQLISIGARFSFDLFCVTRNGSEHTVRRASSSLACSPELGMLPARTCVREPRHFVGLEKTMSDKWKIIHQESGIVADVVAQVGSLGTMDGPITFTIENVETGEARDVTAWDRDEVGQRIAAGEFDDD